MSKKKDLEKLKEKMEQDDSLPLKKGATKLVFGDGNPDTKILFIGEGPGFNEDREGVPFVGAAGNLLNRGLKAIKLDRKEVFITNVVHHRPPNNRDPQDYELVAYGKYLDKIIEIIKPKIIVTLGRFSMGKFLPGVKISSIHGKNFKLKWHGINVIIIPMFHPAAALRSQDVMNKFREDFLNLPKTIEETSKKEIKQMNLI